MGRDFNNFKVFVIRIKTTRFCSTLFKFKSRASRRARLVFIYFILCFVCFVCFIDFFFLKEFC